MIDRAAKLGTKLEWMGSDHDHVKAITGPMPGIRFDKESQQKIWFNGLAVSYSGRLSLNKHQHIQISHYIIMGNFPNKIP